MKKILKKRLDAGMEQNLKKLNAHCSTHRLATLPVIEEEASFDSAASWKDIQTPAHLLETKESVNNFVEEMRAENSQPLNAKLIMIKSERANIRSSEGLIGVKNEMVLNSPSMLKS